ncbi:MAG: hypothetical protein AAF639_13215 [Chloroflexota bacterium]
MDRIVRKLKFDGTIKSEWEGILLPDLMDDWVVVLHHPDYHHKYVDDTILQADQYFVHCHGLTLENPLTVLLQYDQTGRFLEAKCDAALPTHNNSYHIVFVDLDLDLIVDMDETGSLSYTLRDEDDFEHNCIHMDYPDGVVELAYRGISLARKLVETRQFPFDQRFVPQFDDKFMFNIA